jgi:cell division protein FtsB
MDEYSETIRKKMQSLKADNDQIFATIKKHEKENKDANTISKKDRSILDLQEDASTLRFVR